MKNELVVYNAVFCHKVTPNDDEWEEANSYKQFDSNEQYAYIDDTYISSTKVKDIKEKIKTHLEIVGNNNYYCFLSKFVFKDLSKDEKELILNQINEEGFLYADWFDQFEGFCNYKNAFQYYVGSINNFKNITKYTD